MTRKKYFNKYEKEILRLLYKENRPMTIREIAEKVDMSWVTARKWLNILKNKGLVKHGKKKTTQKGKGEEKYQRKMGS